MLMQDERPGKLLIQMPFCSMPLARKHPLELKTCVLCYCSAPVVMVSRGKFVWLIRPRQQAYAWGSLDTAKR